MAAPARVYFRDALGRFASRNGAVSKFAGRLGKSAGDAFVGGVLDAGVAEAQRRAFNSLTGKSHNVRTGQRTFNRYGRARNRAVNRMNAAKYSPTGRRVRAGVRTISASARRARTGARNSRPIRGLRNLNNRRISRRIERMNVAARVQRPGPGARAMPQSMIRRQRRARARSVRRL